MFVAVAGPAVVLLLRWRIGRRLHQHQQQQQQQQQRAAYNSKEQAGSSSSSSSAALNASLPSSISAVCSDLAAAGQLKQRLLLYWTLLVLGWQLLVLGGSPLIVEPAMVTRYWKQRGLTEDVAVLFSFAVKAYVLQVRTISTCCRVVLPQHLN
jgi:hypothetical protein